MPATVLRRNLLFTAAIVGGLVACSDTATTPTIPPPPPPPPLVTVTVDPTSDWQTGVVGTPLTRPLRVTVRSDGVPSPGVAITWQVSEGGSIVAASSITDAAGIATASWTLGPVAGAIRGSVNISGDLDPAGYFHALALPGPAAVIAKAAGDAQTVAVNQAAFSSLIAEVNDQFGNAVQGAAVTWSVESGPVTFVTMDGATDAGGRSAAVLAPNGTVGGAVVRAALPGGTPAVNFTLTVGPPAPFVVIVRSNSPKDVFLSAQNGTTNPAVDTIPAGATMEWRVEPWDYFLIYGRDLVSVGQPSFPQQTFPPDDPSTLSVTFTVPGTYHYADSWSPGGTGIIVVQ
jgi:plastocyanin